jgi:hypothetical protein
MNDYEYAAPTEQGGLSAFYAQLDSRKTAPAPQPVAVDLNGEDLPSALPESAYKPLTNLQKAWLDMGIAVDDGDLLALQRAGGYAAIAQAEALTRIAEVMETWLEVQTTPVKIAPAAEVVEHILAHLGGARIATPEEE